MKNKIIQAFPDRATDCIETMNDEKFQILDQSPGKCIISDDGDFQVINPNKKDIHFLAIDHCLLPDDIKKCDFAIFDDTLFVIVEMKNVKTKSRRVKKREAIKQLINTIEIFRKKIDFVGNDLEAIICFAGKKIYPARSSSSNYHKDVFADYDCSLLEGNEKEFS